MNICAFLRNAVSTAWLVVVFVGSVGISFSHPLSVSYSSFTIDDELVRATYRLPMDDMDLLLNLDQDLDNKITDRELIDAHDQIENYLREHVTFLAEGINIDPDLERIATWNDSNDFPYLEAAVTYVAPTSTRLLEVRVGVMTDLYQDHRNLAQFHVGANREQFVFQNGNAWYREPVSTGNWQTISEFTQFGMEHIVTGFDHLLFLLGLLLVGRSFRNLVEIVTSFTIAHSLTLALAALGFINPLSWLVEAGIALSIVYVGLENILLDTVSHRWRITFFFGLLHGFGFAGVLQQMDLARGGLALSLLTFNLGVEIGQVAVVALAWPILTRIAKNPYRMIIVRSLSSVIVILGTYWFVQRIIS